MTQSQHTDQTETTHAHYAAEHVAEHTAEHAHEAPTNAPLLEGISQPLASHHLRILREAHVIDREQQGRTTIYRLKDDHISHIVVDVYEHTREHHAD